jgi:dimethylargininase
LALTRAIGPAIARCALTHAARVPIDLERARREHAAYEQALREAGCTVERLPDAPDLPDAVFVEDTAVVLPTVAVLTRPGAAARRLELPDVERRIADLRPVVRLRAPATLDGGDVLRAGRTLYVGRSGRTNREGIRQLRLAVEPAGFAVVPVAVKGILHLKSAVTELADGLLLVDPAHVDPEALPGFDLLATDPSERGAANALRVGDVVIYPESFPRTRERIEGCGVHVVPVPAGELAKAEGGVTCCSLLVDVDDPPR